MGPSLDQAEERASPLQLCSPPKPNLQFSNCNVFCLSGCHSSHTGITGWRPNFTMVTLLITTQWTKLGSFTKHRYLLCWTFMQDIFVVLILNENLETLCICSCLWAYKITHPAPARIKNGPRNIAVRQHTTLPSSSFPSWYKILKILRISCLCLRHCVYFHWKYLPNLSVDWKFSRRDETEIEFSIKSHGGCGWAPSKYLTPPAPAKPRSALIEADERETGAGAQSDIQIEILVLIVLMIMAPGISTSKILRYYAQKPLTQFPSNFESTKTFLFARFKLRDEFVCIIVLINYSNLQNVTQREFE